MPRRQRTAPTEDWQQLELRFTDPIQRAYELIRPIVLFGDSAAERAVATSTPERTVYRQVERFTSHGMLGLHEQAGPTHTLPHYLRQLIVDLKVEHPPLRVHEIQTICYVQTGRRPDAKTVKRVLTTTPLPFRTTRRFPLYHQIADSAERRRTIVRLHADGWTVTSIAEYLQVSRKTVGRTLKRWVAEGVAGLPDKSRARRPGGRRVTLKTVPIVRQLQENKRLGAYRIAAKLKRLGIPTSPRTCGRLLVLNRQLYGLPKLKQTPHDKRVMPFAADKRHAYWSVDVRYLDTPNYGGSQVYCISILENYSRAVLASAVSPKQDTTAFLRVFFDAVAQFGPPQGLVSDSGSVFRAKQAKDIYRRLGITKHEIERGQPWQNYIETHWSIQRRMADYAFDKATTWDEVYGVHQQWVHDYNAEDHWAHRARADERRSPQDVLGKLVLVRYDPNELHRIFYTTRFTRRVDTHGYVQFRQWRIYGEYGVAGQRTVIWLYGETLTVVFNDTPLAQYRVTYQPDLVHLRTVTDPQLFDTIYRSAQLLLWDVHEDTWLKVVRLPGRAMPPKRQPVHVVQPRLFA
jgi:transposase InsO family protein